MNLPECTTQSGAALALEQAEAGRFSSRRGLEQDHTLSARPRLGFLGVGWIGRHRMEAIARSGVAEVGAVAEPVREQALQAAQLAPGCAVFASLEELLAAGVDGVVIATPSALHAEQAIAALERGIPVFCQKPLGRTGAETVRVIEAARKNDVLLGVDFSYRFLAGTRRLRELCQQGELGDIFAADLVFHNAYGPDKPWFYERQLAGGGCLMDLGIHLVDLALWCLDYPPVTGVSGRLFAQGKPLSRCPEAVEDFAIAQLELANGATVRISCSWKLPVGCDAIITGSFYGTKGGAGFRNLEGSFYNFVAERYQGTQRNVLAEPPDEWGGRAAVDWAQRLARGARFDSEVDSVGAVARVLDRIYACGSSEPRS